MTQPPPPRPQAETPFERVRPAAVLFDLDGTLIDTIPLILASYHHTLAHHGKPRCTDEELLAHVGTPLVRHLAHYATDEEELAAMVTTYRSWNLARHDTTVRAFEGTCEAVCVLARQGIPLAVVTSKQASSAVRGLEVAGFGVPGKAGCAFRLLVGADDVTRHKPDPWPLLVACERLGVAPEATAYVGDSPHDLAAAHGAGALAVAVGWGPFPRASLDAVGVDVWLERPGDLLALEALPEARTQPTRRS